ncbi:MAG TPA: beta-ketoacyl-ACP reductase [Actinomycetota bacterium]|nr:beta-ketoacyl-ACP reductase [Actinomycetota bacterium]
MPDRVALVTGASRGIGRAISVALAQAGHPVAVNYMTRGDDAKETLALVEDAGGEGVVVRADVGDPKDIQRAFAEVEEALGAVQVLVNNAGVRADGLMLSMSDESWEDVLRVNLSGTFYCCRRALKSMLRARWGRIVNISSVAGLRASPGQVNYSAAKAGVIGLTKTLAKEVASKGITVNAVAPGLIETELVTDIAGDRLDKWIDEIPVRRRGTPEEIAHTVRFLCSEEAAYVTGGVFVTDGGLTS